VKMDRTNLTVIWPFHLSVGNENLKSFHNYRHGLNLLSFFRTPDYFLMLRRPSQMQLLSQSLVYVTQQESDRSPLLSLWLVMLHPLLPQKRRMQRVPPCDVGWYL